MNMVMPTLTTSSSNLSSWSTISYLWSDSAATSWLSSVPCFRGGRRVARYPRRNARIPRWAVLALPVCVVLAWYGAKPRCERRHMQFYFENLYVSSFYAPGETLEALWRERLLEAAPRAARRPGSPFRRVQRGRQAARISLLP